MTALNSTATLVAYDLFKRHNPAISDHKLVAIGKVTTVVGTLLAIVCSPLFGHYTTIFEGMNKLISYVAPPITAVFVLGVFWKRASGKSAFITLIGGMLSATVLTLIVLLPLAGFFANGLLGNRLGKPFVTVVGCGLPLLAFALAIAAATFPDVVGRIVEAYDNARPAASPPPKA